jgi:hypothetical protein
LNNLLKYFVLLVASFFFTTTGFTQDTTSGKVQVTDTTAAKVQVTGTTVQSPDSIDQKIDSVLRTHSPRTAAIRSAMVPGWGQAYNKKYWKIPIVYAALGTSVGVFVYNLRWYKRTRFAFTTLTNKDTLNYGKIHPRLQAFVNSNDLTYLQYYRNEYRRDLDYSVIAFLVLWGLNVVDATVDAHLKTFDVSPDLTFRVKPGFSEMGNTHGLSLILAFK